MSIVNAQRSTGNAYNGTGITVYVLELEQKYWLIGQTKHKFSSLEELLKKCISPSAVRWIELHKPVRLKQKYVGCTVFDEDKYTKTYMGYYGIDAVRGGAYCMLIMDKVVRSLLEYELSYIEFRMRPEPKLSSSLLSSQLGMAESMTDSVLSNSYVIDEKASTSKALTKTADEQSTWDVLYEQYVTAWEMGSELVKYIWPFGSWNPPKSTETIR